LELRDLIVTPFIILFVYTGAYLIRPYVTDAVNLRYFFPALTVRIFGAIAVGFIYQFYYSGGDTFSYHTFGSRIIWEAIMDSPYKGFKLLFSQGQNFEGVYEYATRIYFFRDPASYVIIQIATFFDLFTFSSYSATAVLFAVISFTGSWMFFLTFYEINPLLHRWFAIASFFIPSVFFWGSGILKDSITLAALGSSTYFFHRMLIQRKVSISGIFFLIISLYFIFAIKKFILQAFFPAVIVWFLASYYNKIHNFFIRAFCVPIVGILCIYFSYMAALQVGKGDSRYALNQISNTARVTAHDIRYWSGRNAGSGYSLGELNDTPESMLRLAPQAIVVSLFRPFLWEVNNPLMLFSALESMALFIFTLYAIKRRGWRTFKTLTGTHVAFCITFVLIFAFAVGVSTFNFGTLVRYKIPLMPFFVTLLAIIAFHENNDRKLSELDSTE